MKFYATRRYANANEWRINLQEKADPTIQTIGTITFAKTPVSKWVFAPDDNQLAFELTTMEAVTWFLAQVHNGNRSDQLEWTDGSNDFSLNRYKFYVSP